MDFTFFIDQIIFYAAVALGLLLGLAILFILRKAYAEADKNNLLADNELIEQLSNIGVRAAEQLYHSTDGPAKKEYAINMVLKALNEKGIKINREILDSFVEASVQFIKQDKKKDENIEK